MRFKMILALMASMLMVAQPALAQQAIGASVRTVAPSYINGETRPLSMDPNGNLRVITTASGGSSIGAQGASTTGQMESLVACAATAAAPTYTTGTTNPLSCDLKGAQRGLIMDTTGTPIDWTAPSPIYSSGSVTAAAGGTPVTTVQNVSNTVFRTSATNVFEVGLTAGTTAGLMMVWDATSVPADGAVTPLVCLPVVASGQISHTYTRAARFATGVAVALSSGTDCQAKVAITAEVITIQYAQ